jgi:ferredoxin
MRVLVDRDLCEANQVCMRLVREVFLVDEEDQLHILVDSIEPGLRDRVKAAVRACPRQALSIVEDPEGRR